MNVFERDWDPAGKTRWFQMILNGGLALVPPPTPPLLTLQSHPEMITHNSHLLSIKKASNSRQLFALFRETSLYTLLLFSRYFFTSFVLTHTLSAFVHKSEHTVFLILVCFSGKFFSTSFFFHFVLHSVWSFASKVSVSLRSKQLLL